MTKFFRIKKKDKRIPVNYIELNADPKTTWANPDKPKLPLSFFKKIHKPGIRRSFKFIKEGNYDNHPNSIVAGNMHIGTELLAPSLENTRSQGS